MEAKNLSHGTTEEIKFINELGAHAPNMEIMNTTRILINRYIRSLDKRSDFCGIDRDKVLAAAMKRLVKLTKDESIG